MRALPPHQCLETLAVADSLVASSLRNILRIPNDYLTCPTRTALMARASFPTRMGGLNLPKLLGEADLAHVSAFAAAAEDLHARLLTLAPNAAALRVAESLQEVPEEMAWGHSLREARRAITPLLRLPPDDVETLRSAAPEGPPSIKCGIRLNRSRPPGRVRGTPEWCDAYADIASLRVPSTTAMAFRRVKGLQSKLSRAKRAREYLAHLTSLKTAKNKRETARLLSTSGGGVAFTVSDDPIAHAIDPDEYVTAVRNALGFPPDPANEITFRCAACHQSQSAVSTRSNDPEMAMADHLPRCPAHANATAMHDVVRRCLARLIATETTVRPRDIVTEKTNLVRDTRLRPSDILIYDFNGRNKHLLIDVGVSSATTNTALSSSQWKKPGACARAYEGTKTSAVLGHRITLRGTWDYVPFVLEDGGRPGVHAAALLAEMDKRQTPCEYTGLRVSLKTRLLQAVSASIHQFKAQLVLSRGLLRS